MSKAIVITGGSRGIGAATARLAGVRGWSVAVNYAGNVAAARATAAAVEQAGGRAITVRGDVAVEREVVALFDAAAAAFGRVDGLVNNAGILMAPPLPLAEMGAERLRTVIGINLIGAMLAAREAIRRMAQGRGGAGGAIVNVTSPAARIGSPGQYADYAASKGGLETLTVGLAKEVGPQGVRVNAVRPGLIDTDIHASGGQPGRVGRLAETVPLGGRAGTPDEVAEAIIWLLSDAASYVSGAILDVSGGRMAVR